MQLYAYVGFPKSLNALGAQRASLRELFYRDHFDGAGAQAAYETSIVHDEAGAHVNAVVNICSSGCSDVGSERQLSTRNGLACGRA